MRKYAEALRNYNSVVHRTICTPESISRLALPALVFACGVAVLLRYSIVAKTVTAGLMSTIGIAAAGLLLATAVICVVTHIHNSRKDLDANEEASRSSSMGGMGVLNSFALLAPVFLVGALYTLSAILPKASLISMSGMPIIAGIACLVGVLGMVAAAIYSKYATGRWKAIFTASRTKGAFGMVKAKYKVQQTFLKAAKNAQSSVDEKVSPPIN